MQSSVYRDKASSIAMILETQRNVEFPHRIVDKRPRKRPRLTWDAAPPLLPPPPPPTVTNCPHIVLVSMDCSFVVFIRYCELC
jgi:dual-specificity kinase